MSLDVLKQLFTPRDLRNAALGAAIVLGGIALAAVTLFAHYTNNAYLAGAAAAISLVFVVLILFFVVPPLARNASREASQLNLPFEFTAGGGIMAGLILIVGFSAWNTGNNLLFLVLSFLLASMAVSFIAGSLCLKKLDVKMRFPETIFAGEETPLAVSIHNRKRIFPSYSVVAEVRGRERVESVTAGDLRALLPRFIAERLARAPIIRRTLDHFPYLPRNAVTENTVAHVFPTRGRLVIKDFELYTRFPFAFYRHRRRLPARETELFVLPRIEPLSSEIDDAGIDFGRLSANRRGSGQDLLSLRGYRPDDDLRRIDWKATARSRDLVVKEFAAEDDRRITIILDTRVEDEDFASLSIREKMDLEQKGAGAAFSPRFEKGVGLAASLLSHFADLQAETRLIIDEDVGDFGVGSRHLIESLKRLAIQEPTFIDAANAARLPGGLPGEPKGGEASHIFVVRARSDEDELFQLARNVRFLSF